MASGATDWLWYDMCPTCLANPGGACLDQRRRLTATIVGQGPLRRPHDGRPTLPERIVPVLSDQARQAMPEVLAWIRANIAYSEVPWRNNHFQQGQRDQFKFVAFLLEQAATEEATTREDPTWQ